MTHTRINNFLFYTLLVAAILFVGAGCSSEKTPDTQEIPEEVVVDTKNSNNFSGLDGSITEFAFDDVAKGFNTYLAGAEAELPDQEWYDIWVQERDSDELFAINDTFENPIKIQEVGAREYRIWTEGEDKQVDTVDDYYKTYSY